MMPIQPETLSKQVYEQIRQKILSREFVPGMKFTYRQLAEQLKVSRIPIGEAIRQLEQDGLVVCTGRGVYINPLTIKDVEEIFDIRELLEGLSCRLFTPVATTADLELLKAYSDEWDRHLAGGNFDLAQEANVKFHRHIAQRCPYPYLARLIDTLLLRVRTISLTTFGGKKKDWPKDRWGHQKIIDAIARKNPQEAEEAMREHIRWGKEDVIAAMLREGKR